VCSRVGAPTILSNREKRSAKRTAGYRDGILNTLLSLSCDHRRWRNVGTINYQAWSFSNTCVAVSLLIRMSGYPVVQRRELRKVLKALTVYGNFYSPDQSRPSQLCEAQAGQCPWRPSDGPIQARPRLPRFPGPAMSHSAFRGGGVTSYSHSPTRRRQELSKYCCMVFF
jgi:hypothetical protein